MYHEKRNLTMMTDLYELTMMYGYFSKGMYKNEAVFDVFFRPREQTRYAIMCGVESVIDYINHLHFDEEDIAYLRSLHLFSEAFLDFLRELRFTGEIYAMPEGTVVFPYEPLVRVKAPICQAQLIETAVLTFINHQTLIATKASKVCQAAQGDGVMEFGLRRAQGADAAILGARAAVCGTHAHSWVMSFPDELTAFRAYAELFPDSCLLLVDTYDTLRSGVPNAIKVFKELREQGHEPIGIRLDSGDMAYLSKQARKMLDEAGFPKATITASSDLDETVIRDLKMQGACIDGWGVGTRLITSEDNPALGGVYKLAAEIVDGKIIPKIKLSNNTVKITNPGYKKVYRIYDKYGMATADLICLNDETFDEREPLTIFDPEHTFKRMTLTDYHMRELLVPLFIDGKQVYESPDIHEICAYEKKEMASMWEEYRRLLNPHTYKVDLSDRLYALKQQLINENVGIYEGR